MKNICVFCSSSNDIHQQYIDVAKELGKVIALNKYDLIHGGGKIGLMGVISQAVKQNGAKVIGVIPDRLDKIEITSTGDDELIITKSMSERKNIMTERADAFIALPGGFGTLDEIIEVITLKQLRYHAKPIVFLNTQDYFRDLFNMFETMYKQQFSDIAYKNLYHIAETPQEIIKYIQNYKATKVQDAFLDD